MKELEPPKQNHSTSISLLNGSNKSSSSFFFYLVIWQTRKPENRIPYDNYHGYRL